LQRIWDDSDELIQAKFKPLEISNGFPTKITLTFEYYQESIKDKKMVAITAVLGEYKNFVEGEDRQYELNVVYQAMSYFDLINNF